MAAPLWFGDELVRKKRRLMVCRRRSEARMEFTAAEAVPN
jgi:hypothetical protein